MLLEVLIGAALAFLAATNVIQVKVRLQPRSLAEGIIRVSRLRGCLVLLAAEVRAILMSRAAREEALAQERARKLYDATVGEIFQTATDQEKETILGLFRKYMPRDR